MPPNGAGSVLSVRPSLLPFPVINNDYGASHKFFPVISLVFGHHYSIFYATTSV